MKASHCDECKHATVKWYEYKGPPAFDVLTCAKKHKPRHYMPRNAMDTDYGWKRVCADFETHNAGHEGREPACRRSVQRRRRDLDRGVRGRAPRKGMKWD